MKKNPLENNVFYLENYYAMEIAVVRILKRILRASLIAQLIQLKQLFLNNLLFHNGSLGKNVRNTEIASFKAS